MNREKEKESANYNLQAIETFVRNRKGSYSRESNINNLFRAVEIGGSVYFELLPNEGGPSTALLERTMDLLALEEALALAILQEPLAEFDKMLSQLYMNSSNGNKIKELINEFRAQINQEII